MPPRFGRALLSCGLLLLVAAGCAQSPPPPPVPGPVSTPPIAPLPPAEDGDDLGACVDGSCEVQLRSPSAIPLHPGYGVQNLRVESIGPDRVGLYAELVEGGEYAVISCRYQTRDGDTAGLKAECEPGGTLTLPSISLGVAVIRGNAAIIRTLPR